MMGHLTALTDKAEQTVTETADTLLLTFIIIKSHLNYAPKTSYINNVSDLPLNTPNPKRHILQYTIQLRNAK